MIFETLQKENSQEVARGLSPLFQQTAEKDSRIKCRNDRKAMQRQQKISANRIDAKDFLELFSKRVHIFPIRRDECHFFGSDGVND